MKSIKNKEYINNEMYINSMLNENLIKYATKFYRESLTPYKERELCSLSITDKIWLLEQYKEEIQSGVPDLSSIY